MSEWKQAVPIRLDARAVERIDEFVEQFYPFCEGRSALVRVLVEVALAAIDDGTLAFDLDSIQRILNTPRKRKLKVEPKAAFAKTDADEKARPDLKIRCRRYCFRPTTDMLQGNDRHFYPGHNLLDGRGMQLLPPGAGAGQCGGDQAGP